jgi:hypothetical protein
MESTAPKSWTAEYDKTVPGLTLLRGPRFARWELRVQFTGGNGKRKSVRHDLGRSPPVTRAQARKTASAILYGPNACFPFAGGA